MIDADQELPARAQELGELDQEGLGFLGREVAQGAAGVEAQQGLALQQGMGGELVEAAVIAADAQHGHLGVLALELVAGGGEVVGADIEGHVGGRLEGLQQRTHLAGIACAEFHQHPRPQGRGEGACLGLEQAGFGAGQAVFGLLTDGIKQPGTLRVVEQPGRQLLGLAGHALAHQPRHVGRLGMQIDQHGFGPDSEWSGHPSIASLSPDAIQRLAGG